MRAWMVLLSVWGLCLAGCGPSDTPSETLAAPPASLEDRIRLIEDDPNLSAERKAFAIDALRQQEKVRGQSPSASGSPGR